MARVASAADAARRAFRREPQTTTRSTSIPAGALMLVAFLAWALLDRALEPAVADDFLVARIIAEAGVAVAFMLILTRRVTGTALESGGGAIPCCSRS